MKPAIFDRRQLTNTNYAIQSWVKFKSIRSHRILFSGSVTRLSESTTGPGGIAVTVELAYPPALMPPPGPGGIAVTVELACPPAWVVRVVESSLQDVTS